MKKIARIAVIALAMAALVYFGAKYMRGSQSKPEAGEHAIAAAAGQVAETEAAIPVRVTELKRGDLALRLTVTAESQARERAAVKTEVSGVVKAILHREGEWVAAGEPVVRLESREVELALRQAEASRLEKYSNFLSQYSLLAAGAENRAGAMGDRKNRYEEALKQFKKGRISKEEMEKTEELLLAGMIESGSLQDEVKRCVSGLTASEVALERARLDLERTVIRAPFSGTVSALQVSVGERLPAGSEAFALVNLASVFLRASVLETEIGKIRAGQRARIRFISDPGRPLYGRVTALSPEIDRDTRTGTVFIALDHPGGVRSGLNAEVDIETETVRDVLKIPRHAMLVRSNRTLIFTVENDTALWKYVEIGAGNDEEIEIKSGELQAGDRVVIEGQLTLAHQARVKVLE